MFSMDEDTKLALSVGFNINNRFAHFFFSGDQDEVRKITRDLVFGLKVLGGIEGKVEHLTEIMKMRAQLTPEDPVSQINIQISILAFDRLVLVFRYCYQKGILHPPIENQVQFYHNEYDLTRYPYSYSNAAGELINGVATIDAYVEEAKLIASKEQTKLEIPSYHRPDNRNFWLRSELAEDRQQHLREIKSSQSFLKSSNLMLDSKEGLEARRQNIIKLVAIMCESHPLNPNYGTMYGMALTFLNNYCFYKNKQIDQNKIRCYSNEETEVFIKPSDKQKFFLLAEKYQNLQKNLQTLREEDIVNNDSCCRSCSIQ